MKKEYLIYLTLGIISFVITYSLISWLNDDSNGFIGGTTDDGHGYIKLISWYNDSLGYHLTFFGLANYSKNFTTSKIADLNPYVGHYIEIGYNSYDGCLNWIHTVEG